MLLIVWGGAETISVKKGQVYSQIKEGRLEVERSLMGRILASMLLMVIVFPLAMGGLTIFFSPDLIFGDLMEGEPVAGLFWFSLLGVSAVVTLLSGFVRLMRRERWIFDGPRGVVVAEVSSLFGAPAVGEVSLGEIKKLRLISRGGFGQSALSMELLDGVEETLFSGRTLGGELEHITSDIEKYLKEERYFIGLERTPQRVPGEDQ